jgi:hypothetical protein
MHSFTNDDLRDYPRYGDRSVNIDTFIGRLANASYKILLSPLVVTSVFESLSGLYIFLCTTMIDIMRMDYKIRILVRFIVLSDGSSHASHVAVLLTFSTL